MSKKTITVHHPPPTAAEVARDVAERRRRDGVSELGQGFTFRADGRYGYIYYREGDKLIEMIWEMSGIENSDIILHIEGLRKWQTPTECDVEPEKQKELLVSLKAWLASNRIRAVLRGDE